MPIKIELEDAEVSVVQKALGEFFAEQIQKAAAHQRQAAQDEARIADNLRSRIEAICDINEAAPNYPKPKPVVGESPSVPVESVSGAGLISDTQNSSSFARAVEAPELIAKKPKSKPSASNAKNTA